MSSTHDKVRGVLQRYYDGELDCYQAERELCSDEVGLEKEEMAEFIVDVFARGWISPLNMGIDESDDEGNVP